MRRCPAGLVEDEGAGALLLGAEGAEEFAVAEFDGDAVVRFGGGVGAAFGLGAALEVGGIEDVGLAGAVGEQDRPAGVLDDVAGLGALVLDAREGLLGDVQDAEPGVGEDDDVGVAGGVEPVEAGQLDRLGQLQALAVKDVQTAVAGGDQRVLDRYGLGARRGLDLGVGRSTRSSMVSPTPNRRPSDQRKPPRPTRPVHGSPDESRHGAAVRRGQFCSAAQRPDMSRPSAPPCIAKSPWCTHKA